MESDPDTDPLREVWVYLTDDEARDLLLALDEYFSEPQRPGWHCHITDALGNELSVGVGESEDPERFASRFGKPA
jgi:hypothetical protein